LKEKYQNKTEQNKQKQTNKTNKNKKYFFILKTLKNI